MRFFKRKKIDVSCELKQATESIERLKDLTQNLPVFPSALKMEPDGYAEYEMNNGLCRAWDLGYAKTAPMFSVTKWWASEDTHFPCHQHPEKEYLIVVEGEAEIWFYTDKDELVSQQIIKAGDPAVMVLPKALHAGIFSVETFFISVMIPSADYYPKTEMKNDGA